MILKRLIPIPVVYLGITLAYFFPMLSSTNIFVERDLAAFFIPPRYLWVDLVKSFQLPLWNPYNYSGIPLLATLQPGVFYPPHILYFLLPFNIAWNWIIILHFYLAALTTYSLLKYFKASTGGAFLGGIAFMLSGYLISVHNLLTHLLAVVWFPLIIVQFLKYFETSKANFLVFTSILLAVQFFAGAPEISILTVFVLCVMAAFAHCLVDTRIGVTSPTFKLKALCVTLGLFILISSVQLLPFLELKAHSIRIAGLSYLEATTWSFAWRDFVQFFIPDAFGYFTSTKKYWSNQSWLLTLYWGITPFILSFFYFISNDKKRLVFTLLMATSLVFALGGNTPAYKVLHHIPPFSSIRYPVKFIFLFIFLVAVTAGLGFDNIKRGVQEGNLRIRRTIVVFFYSGFVFVLLWGFMSIFGDAVYRFFETMKFVPDVYNDAKINIHNIKRFLMFSFIFCIMLLVYLRVRSKKTASFLIILTVALDIFLANNGYYTSGAWKFYINTNEWGEHTFLGKLSDSNGMERYFVTFKTLGEFNHFPYDRAIVAPPYAPLFGLYSLSGAEVLRVGHYEAFSNMLKDAPSLELGKRFLDVSGVRYVVSAYELTDRDFTLLQSIEAGQKVAHLYEYASYSGRFLLYGKIHTVKNDKEAGERLRDQAFDLKQVLIINSEKEIALNEAPPRGTVKLVSYSANKVSLDCITEGENFLYVTDAYFPGWRAYVDGKETPIYRANLAFRAVYLPKGIHSVTFLYCPLSFYIGCCLSVIGLLVSLYILNRKKCQVETHV